MLTTRATCTRQPDGRILLASHLHHNTQTSRGHLLLFLHHFWVFSLALSPYVLDLFPAGPRLLSEMSFNDIESGYGSPRAQPTSSPEDGAFASLQSSLALQVFKINANVQGILKLVDQLGTPRDSAALRKSLCVIVNLLSRRGLQVLKDSLGVE